MDNGKKGNMALKAVKIFKKNAFKTAGVLFFLVSILSPLSSFVFAETRIKTVEYNFGGYYNATDLASGTQYNFPPRLIKLPENGKTIKSAWLEYSGMTASRLNVNPLVIYFDSGSTPSTARFTSTQYTAQTGESIILWARSDVASVIQAQLANLSNGVIFSAGFKITGPSSNGHTMKLYITYEYDDESPLQVKTVRFPLYSDYANKIAAFTTQKAAGTMSMQYMADISENSGFNIQQQWFEIGGYVQNPSSGIDASIYVNIGGATNEPTMWLDSGLRDCYYFRYLSSSTIIPGFSTGTVQAINIVTTRNAINALSGEVVITYEFSTLSVAKTETTRFYFGHYIFSDMVTSAYFELPLYLSEEGITLKEVYQRIVGSYNNTTPENITIESNIGLQTIPARSYAQAVTQLQISGYEFFHSLTGAISGWSNGTVIGSTITVPQDAGAHGIELIVTYSYTNDAAHTSSYGIYGGNSTSGITTPYSYTSGVYWVESGSSKTLSSAYVYENAINNTNVADIILTTDFNGNSPQDTANKSASEAATFSRFYQNNSQVTVGTTSFTANYTISSAGGAFSSQGHITYLYIPPPKNPVSLAQYVNGQVLPTGIWTNSSSVRFEGVVASSMNVDNLALVVEVKPDTSAFDETSLSTGAFSPYNGVAFSTSVIVNGLVSGTFYKWRAAAVGNGNRGQWVNFTAPSFGVDLSSPPAPAMSSITPVDGSSINYTAVNFSFEGVTDIDGSGLKNYQLQLATSTDFTTLVFSSSPLTPSASVSGLTENQYFWRVRAIDNAGNTGDWSVVRSFIVDLTNPVINDQQNGDFTWRNANTGLYSVYFNDSGGAFLEHVDVKITTGPGQSGIILADWTPVLTNINSSSYSDLWPLTSNLWLSLQSWATNYISVRVYDNAGNYSVLNDVFKVFKDTVPPSYTNAESGGDMVWRKIARNYNFDFSDYNSGLAGAAYAARTGPNYTGFLTITTTAISGVSGFEYTLDWPVDFNSLAGDSTNYISIEIYDIAGNTTTVTDAFFVKKDTTPPSYINGEAGGDMAWRNTGRNYNFDFSDDGSGLAAAIYSAWTGPGNTGVMRIPNTSIANVGGKKSYTSDWPVDFVALAGDSTNYISVEIYDIAGNTTTVTDAFFIKKDTTPPSILDNQSGDNIWRGAPGTAYNVDFADISSGLYGAEYAIYPDTGLSGIPLKSWTVIFQSTGGLSDYTQDWQIDFAALISGVTCYVSVRTSDTLNNISQLNDVFYVLKDTVVPYIAITTPSSGYIYDVDPGPVIDIDFFDDFSGLTSLEYKITTGPAYSGELVKDWTLIASGAGAKSYLDNWAVDFYRLPVGVVTYVSVRASDTVGNLYESVDVTTYERIGSNNPDIVDNQPGDNIWRNADTGIYDIDFVSNSGFNISSFAITAWSLPNQGGSQIVDYVKVADVNASSYSLNWVLPQGFWELLISGTNYISVKVWDDGGYSSELKDAFYVLKDTELPSGILSPPRYINSFNFNIPWSASDQGYSAVDYIKLYYTYDTYAPYTWLQYGSTYPLSPVAFSAAQYGEIGFRLIVYDRASNRDEEYDPPLSSTAPEVYTLIDSTSPIAIDNQPGDFIWRTASGTYYNVDFSANGGSPLSSAEYQVSTGTGGTGQIIKPWTHIVQNINSSNYTADWTVDFDALRSGINYVSVRMTNLAGNVGLAYDVFEVRKDTTAPALTDNQPGDYTWRNSNSGYYNVFFQDNDSLLNQVEVRITTGTGGTGTVIADWAPVLSNINSSSYSDPWPLTSDLWFLLPSGTSYVSVRAMDNAGQYGYIQDAFFVLKDTIAPSIVDLQNGDDIWRNSNSANYSVYFNDDGGSLLRNVEAKIMTGSGLTGSLISDWTPVLSNINSSSYSDPWSLTSDLWQLLPAGTSYVSVRVYDYAGSTVSLIDAFYVRKDISGPVITDNQLGDDIWRSTNNATYSVYFQDNYAGLDSFYILPASGPGQSGVLSDWTKVSDISGTDYSLSWSLPAAVWDSLIEGINYISVRSSDTLGNYSEVVDAFYVKKDTTSPSITDAQSDETTWHSANTGVYNVDFTDNSSGISKFQVKITSGPGQSGLVYVDWTDNVTNINSPSYSVDWYLESGIWDLLSSGTSYVSVKVFDIAGLSTELADVFTLLKDTDPPSAITGLSVITGGGEGELAVSFNAPADTGELDHYIVKYSLSLIDDTNFDLASEYTSPPLPAPEGSPESFSITGLTTNTLYYVAIKTVDKAGNISAISNVVSAVSGTDTTPPATISDLGALPGSYEGEIYLSWTAVGDNVNIGTATAYQVRYRTDQAITTTNLWDSAVVYSQSWVPKAAGEIENMSATGFQPGATYYFAVRAVDEANNIGGLSNSTATWAQLPQGNKGIFVYQSGTNNTPYYKSWLPPSFSGAGAAPATDALPTSNIRHVVVRASPFRGEKIAGILSSDGVLQIQRYNGASGAGLWTNEWSTTTIGANNSLYRGFDIAYEQNSGRVMVLYNGANPGELYYNIYDGISWTGARTLSTGTAEPAIWVRLEPRPNSNEIMAAFFKENSLELYAIRWDGSSWTSGQQIRNGVGIITKQDWDLAWESQSGACLVTYNAGTIGRADTWRWDGSAWSQITASYFSFQGANGTAEWIRLASDPNSNYIGATSVDSVGDWNASIWDGSSWGYQATENINVRNIANQSRTIDAVWESQSSKLIVVSAQGGTSRGILYSSWTLAGSWGSTLASAQTLGSWTGRVYGVGLVNDKDVNTIVLWGYSASSDLRTAVWNGSAFVFNPAGAHTTALSQYAYMPVMLVTDRHDVIPPQVMDNQAGDDIWRNTNYASYNLDATDSGGSHLAAIQTRIYTGPNSAGTLIEDWTSQVSTGGVDSYTLDWPLLANTWNKLLEGYNYVSVRSVDNSSNKSEIITDAFYVKKDITPPSIPSLSQPPDNSQTEIQTVYFDWSDSVDTVSGISGYEIIVSTDENFSSISYSASPLVSESTSSVLVSGKYYWKVRSFDNAGNYSAYSSTFAVTVDTTPPVITDNQPGDDIWHNSSGTVYNVDFYDNGLIESLEYTAYTGAGFSGAQVIPWTIITSTPLNLSSYTADWEVNFNLLAQGTNYISVRVWDNSGSTTTLADVFYVKKDTAAPSIVDNQPGDDIWRNSNSGVYDVDFADNISLLKDLEIKITTGPGQTGTLISDWTIFASTLNSSSYVEPLSLSSTTWSLVVSGINYVSVRAVDNAGNIAIQNDVFYVKKDTTLPSIPVVYLPADRDYVGNLPVGFLWSASTDAEAGIDFYELYISTTENFSDIYSSGTFTNTSGSFNLPDGLYYWKVRAVDRAANYSTWSGTSSFIVDIAPPTITDNQPGDDIWHNSSGTVYNVDFYDNGLIESLEYTAYTGAGFSGVQIIPWTIITSTPLNLSSYTADWEVNFNLLAQGTNYISVRVWDNSGSTTTLADVFYVKKDTAAPGIVDNQPGDDIWRAMNNGSYDVDAFDSNSLLKDMEIKITTAPDQGGSLVTDWTPVLTALNTDAYTSNWSLPFTVWELMPVGTNYVSVRVSDNAGNYAQITDVFYVRKDTNPVSITDNQDGDNIWRNSNSGLYNIDAHSPTSPLDRIQVKISTLPAYENIFLTDWTDAVSAINVNTYDIDWALPQIIFDAMLPEVTNYVSVKVINQAGAYNEAMDVFYVLKDTIAPSLINNVQGDYTWRNTSGTLYNVDFIDYGGSKLGGFEISASTDTGGGPSKIFDYTLVTSSPLVLAQYTADWSLSSSQFDALMEEVTNYISIRFYDIAGNTVTVNDVFMIFKDTTIPVIIDNQQGDDIWRKENSGLYNIGFSDYGGSKLSRFQIRASTNSGTVGPFSPDWTDNITGINSSSFSGPWSLDPAIFNLLNPGTSYISIRVYDNAGNVYTYPNQPFYILKDTITPSIIDNQDGDYIWRNSSGTTYSVSFADTLSGLDTAEIKITAGPGQSGTVISDWTPLFTNLNSHSYSTPWSLSADLWQLLQSGTNYVSVHVWDIAGSTTSADDVFVILKDTEPPYCSDLQAGETFWRRLNTGRYAISCSDNGGSLISKIQLKAFTGPNWSGTQIFDWTDNQTAINTASINNWTIFAAIWDQLLDSATNYISVMVYDNAGSSYTIVDAFTILKDTTPVWVIDNQTGDDIWQASDPGPVYNVDFIDYGAGISSAAYSVYDAPAKAGNQVIVQNTIFGPTTGYISYSADWGVDFPALNQGYNYISVLAWDLAGNSTEYIDVFYVKKDTAVPVVTDLQDGDTTWYRINPGNIYNVDFLDSGIGISTITMYAWTGAGRTGDLLINGDTIYLNTPIAAYTNEWGVTDTQWGLLRQGTNYITVSAYDALGNSSTVVDVFYIQKDTTVPSQINSLSAITPQLSEDEGKLNISWLATGDDGLTGAASYYLLRYHTANIDETNFDSVSVYISTLIPQTAGQAESLTMTGLTPGVTYYIAIKAVDKAGNISPISNVPAQYAGVDKTPPGTILDLATQQGDFTGQIKLSWTAVGEGTNGIEGTGTAYSYLVKYATFDITASNFDAPEVSTYTQNWVPLAYGQVEQRIMEGLMPGTSYSIAIKVLDEVGNISSISNVVVGTATPRGAADGLMIYSESGSNSFKYRTWVPITWSAQADSGISVAATARWSIIRSVPTFANAKIAGILYSDNSLKIVKHDGQTGTWSDITPVPAPSPGGSATRKFDIAVEHNTGRIMVAYYNGVAGAVTYAVYSATQNAWVIGPVSLQMASLTGVVNWVKLKSMPGADRIAIAVLDSNLDLSAAIWDGNTWIDNTNLTTAASIATKESFDIAWETLTGDLLALWGTGTTTNYRKWYSTSTWAGTFAGPNPGGAAQWIRLASDPLSNKIGASYIYGTASWNTAIWRASDLGNWSVSTADTAISQGTTRVTDCAWQSKNSKFLAVAVDDLGAYDNRFDYITWSGGSWSATPAAAPANTYTTFAGSITWLSLVPDPNTDNIMAYGIDTAYDLKSTVWSGTAWADANSSANFLHESSLQNFNYEVAAVDFDRHDNVPPTVVDNQTGDDNWRNSNYSVYNIQATDTGGSHLSRIQTRIYSLAGGNGTLIQDWTDQVTGINQDLYSQPWQLSATTFDLLPQGQSYVHVRVLDGVGNISNVLTDAFYIRKDTTSPAVINNLAAGSYNFWTSTGVGQINIDFSDSGGSQISSMTWSAWSGPGNTGTLYAEDVLIASGTIGNSYTADWSMDFLLLGHGTNYITVSVWDNALSSHVLTDAFKVLKDTQVPANINDLACLPGPVRGSVELSWTAPGDDGAINDNFQGGYIIKYATFEILTEQLFNSATTYDQAIVPVSAGLQESFVLYNLDPDTTYYFNVKAYDKAGNISQISNSTSTIPQKANIYLNEIYPGGVAGSDWVELYNNTPQNVNLNGWKLVYKQGALDSLAPEVDVWTGGTGDIINSGTITLISITSDLNSAQSYSLLLKNPEGKIVDKAQWPSMTSNESFARIYNGSALLEIDPTPTGGYSNSISTHPIKLSEISYSGYKFIELYNTGETTPTLSGFYLRNSYGEKFRFTRKIYPRSYTVIDENSVSDDGLSWQTVFGPSGLKPAGDYLVLEDSSGQTIDRLVWQSASSYSLYDYKAILVSAVNFAQANVATSLVRNAGEGVDTDNDQIDFSASTLQTPFSRNTSYGLATPSSLIYPATGSVIPSNFYLKASLAGDYSAGNSDLIAFVKTGGSADPKSPHIYRLGDIGFNLSSLSEQTTAHRLNNFVDIDSNTLSHNTVYKVVFTLDDAVSCAPQVIISSVIVDSSQHGITISTSALPWINEGTQDDVSRFDLTNNSTNYELVLSSVTLTLLKSNDTPLSNMEAAKLFESILIVRDSDIGEIGKYESAVDADIVAEVLNSSFALDASGNQVIPVNISDIKASISTGSVASFFAVIKSSPGSSGQVPNDFMIKANPALVKILDKGIYIEQNIAPSAEVITTTITSISPAKAPPGTNWPYSPGGLFIVESMVDIYTDGIISSRVYMSGVDGILRVADYTGVEKWTFPTNPLSPIKSAPAISEENGSVYLYFANDNGDVYKLRDDGNTYLQIWKVNVGAIVRSNVMVTDTRIYFGTQDNKVHCLNKVDGTTCGNWLYDTGFDAAISGTVSIDERTGINMGWIGMENGKVIAFRLSDGGIDNQFTTTISAPIYSSPYIDSAYKAASNNLYVASTDKKVYARTSANLTVVPPYWNDFTADSAIRTSPWISIVNGDKYIFIGDDSGKMYKISATSGTVTGEGWVYQSASSIVTSPVVYNGYVYFGAGEYLYALDAITGAVRSGYPVYTGGVIKGDLVIDPVAQTIIFSSNDGKTYMINIQ